MSHHQEDKKCRICGLADEKNVNIFSNTHKLLANKIVTVYPIVLYQHDPLPKSICKKCIYNVTFMYNDVQRVLKTQSKWIGNVRSVQPKHRYIRVLELIESSNQLTKTSIETTLQTDISEQSINRLLYLSTDSSNLQQPTASVHNSILPEKEEIATSSKSIVVPDSNTSIEIKNLKSILELNGCSLLAVHEKNQNKLKHLANSPIKSDLPKKKKTEEFKNGTAHIKKEPQTDDDDDEDDIALAKIALTLTNANRLSNPPPQSLCVKCPCCSQQFNSIDSLAVHQLSHMRITTHRIFQDKYLNKNDRRGRLIIIQGRKTIRCLNCWRLFADNKSILDHWSLAECEFYCQICGTEFAQSPKMLREHVPAAHGVSYRSSKQHRTHFATEIVSVEHPLPPQRSTNVLQRHQERKMELPNTSGAIGTDTKRALKQLLLTTTTAPTKAVQDKNVTCFLCKKDFPNTKARNSHMRKHKPTHCVSKSLPTGDTGMPPEITPESSSEHTKETTRSAVANRKTFKNCANSTTGTDAGKSVCGVRKKFVNLRNESRVVRVKSLNELNEPPPVNKATPNGKSVSNGCKLPPYRILPPPLAYIKQEVSENANVEIKAQSSVTAERSAIKCLPCGRQFDKKWDLTNHGQHCQPFACERCHKSFQNGKDYTLHLQEVHSHIPSN